MGKINLHDQRADPRTWLYDSPALIRTMTGQMLEKHPNLPRGTSILLTSDSFLTNEYTPLFVLRLLYRDPDLTLDRISKMPAPPANWDSYQYVFAYEDKLYRQLKP
jgi:hypothetical protein